MASATDSDQSPPTQPRLKTVFCLRIRGDETQSWSEPEYYRTRKERDEVARFNRVLAGIRTYSYQEKKTVDELEELL